MSRWRPLVLRETSPRRTGIGVFLDSEYHDEEVQSSNEKMYRVLLIDFL